MVRRSTLALGAVGGAVVAVAAWNLYQRVTTEEVPYTVVARVDDVELRRYPAAVLVETGAPTELEAFGRLFRYISGANDGGVDSRSPPAGSPAAEGTSIPMTAPVEVAGRGRSIPMTAPVEAAEGDEGVRMGFYLPATYDVESAPRPTDEAVDLVAVPERTLAVRRFSWRPTDRRVARETERLLATLDGAGVPVSGEPFFMGYEGPGTLPFMRRNEVAVEADTSG